MKQPTMEEVDRKINEFHQRNLDKHAHLHNTYYVCSVDQDGNVTSERYGTNLMTDLGFYIHYYANIWIPEWFYDMHLFVGSGTTPPTLQDRSLEEYIGQNESYANSHAYVVTGYDDLGTTDNGVMYTTYRVGYGTFAYQMTLPDNDNPAIAGHVGGGPTGRTIDGVTKIDTRWETDTTDGRKYFNITEMGRGYNGDLTECYNNTWYYYRKPNNLEFRFLLLDADGNPNPIRKYYNEKLFVYVYHTFILPEATILDAWRNKQYMTISPLGFNWNPSEAFEVVPWSNYKLYRWRTYTVSRSDDGNYYSHPIWRASISSISKTSPSTDRTDPANTGTHTITHTINTGDKLLEDKWLFVSEYTFGDTYNYYWGRSSNNNYCADACLTTYDELTESEKIVTQIYMNNTTTDRFDDQYGETINTDAKNGLMPIMKTESVESIKLFNVKTGKWDIDEQFDVKPYFYNKRGIIIRTQLYSVLCPDGVKRNVWVYHNHFAYKQNDPMKTGPYPGNIISRFTTTGITLFAADKYWDTSTWRQFMNTADVGSDVDENGQLLVQKRYFICYSNTELWFSFRNEDYPKILPQTAKSNITDGGYPHSSVLIVGNQEFRYFTMGDSILTLNEDKTLKHVKYPLIESLYTERGTVGKNLWFKSWYNANVFGIVDVTQQYEFNNNLSKTLLFISNQSYGGAFGDHNDGTYFIASANNASRYSVQIFNASIDIDQFEQNVYDLSDISLWTRNYNRGFTMKNATIPVKQGQVIYPYITWGREYVNGGEDLKYFELWIYDDDDNEIANIPVRNTPYLIKQENAAKAKMRITASSGDVYWSYDDQLKTCHVIVNDNYGDIAPEIMNARHGICVRGTSYMAYNDISTDGYLQKWNIVDMSNPLNADGTPKVVHTFTIDENFIGGTYSGGVGFAHYVYIRMNDKNNIYSVWLYDLNTEELTHLTNMNPGGWLDSTGNRESMFVGNDRCLVYCGATRSNSITNDGSIWGSAIYIIPEDDPKTIYTLFNAYSTMYRLQMKYVKWDDHDDNKQQLLLAAYGRSSYSNTNYRQRVVLDVGLWLKTHSWENGQPHTGFWNYGTTDSNTGNYGDCYIYAHIYDKGVIELNNDLTSKGTNLLVYSPLERWLPHQITCTTKTINAFNNPIIVSGRTYTFTRVNDMSTFGLSNSGEHVYKET